MDLLRDSLPPNPPPDDMSEAAIYARRQMRVQQWLKAIRRRHDLAFAAAIDFGDRRSSSEGRLFWNEDDYHAATTEYRRLMGTGGLFSKQGTITVQGPQVDKR